jgi:hypothetical protein
MGGPALRPNACTDHNSAMRFTVVFITVVVSTSQLLSRKIETARKIVKREKSKKENLCHDRKVAVCSSMKKKKKKRNPTSGIAPVSFGTLHQAQRATKEGTSLHITGLARSTITKACFGLTTLVEKGG